MRVHVILAALLNHIATTTMFNPDLSWPLLPHPASFCWIYGVCRSQGQRPHPNPNLSLNGPSLAKSYAALEYVLAQQVNYLRNPSISYLYPYLTYTPIYPTDVRILFASISHLYPYPIPTPTPIPIPIPIPIPSQSANHNECPTQP